MDLTFNGFPVSGLEYFIEIQHNTVKKTQPDYHCLLCDTLVKAKNMEIVKGHLRSAAHKLRYLVRNDLRLLKYAGN